MLTGTGANNAQVRLPNRLGLGCGSGMTGEQVGEVEVLSCLHNVMIDQRSHGSQTAQVMQ